ncbi:unnamed protein product [Owenia fusiformis]|uniref:Uncharacterized protein n=1 Tax=Owenia fusiformis TaxID=6347 RepID=A0A8S4NJ93_OWEFU|nr:unnamed protein product [Owenia fusiformis]
MLIWLTFTTYFYCPVNCRHTVKYSCTLHSARVSLYFKVLRTICKFILFFVSAILYFKVQPFCKMILYFHQSSNTRNLMSHFNGSNYYVVLVNIINSFMFVHLTTWYIAALLLLLILVLEIGCFLTLRLQLVSIRLVIRVCISLKIYYCIICVKYMKLCVWFSLRESHMKCNSIHIIIFVFYGLDITKYWFLFLMHIILNNCRLLLLVLLVACLHPVIPDVTTKTVKNKDII